MGRDQIPDALRVFEEVRKPRASDVRHRTLDQKAMFALADGPDQEKRDAKLRAGADHELFKWLWEYDAVESGREAWKNFTKTHENGVKPPRWYRRDKRIIHPVTFVTWECCRPLTYLQIAHVTRAPNGQDWSIW